MITGISARISTLPANLYPALASRTVPPAVPSADCLPPLPGRGVPRLMSVSLFSSQSIICFNLEHVYSWIRTYLTHVIIGKCVIQLVQNYKGNIRPNTKLLDKNRPIWYIEKGIHENKYSRRRRKTLSLSAFSSLLWWIEDFRRIFA